ncbi:hypothetical protein B0A55_01966 [Friedmanniomyces simplex]|uniref:Major facilitator superfamily (MFS) profile domain-containing protein n=1 Tax=Friedmanniomyces simplex TaxID=329884 RepID=A0A4U0XQ19_9PEZI|nr:hypothetical protein B0A55_01966 [Friedmanniomyces simplex]
MSKPTPDSRVMQGKEHAGETNIPLEPELTLRSGLATAGAATSYFATVGFLNAYGVFQQYYTSTYLSGKSNFQISWLGAFGTFCVFAFAPAAGILSDKIGPQIPIACGSVMVVVAVFMVSLCREYWQFFLAQALLLGVGCSFIAIPASSVVPQYFKRNRALVSGISVGGSSLGGVIWPIAFDQMLHHDGIGFPWAMRIAGFAMIPLVLFAIITVRPPLASSGLQQEAHGLAEAGHGREPISGGDNDIPKKDLSMLRKPPFILLASGLFIAMFGFFIPLFYVSTYAVSIGMTPTLAFYLVSIVNGASLFGRILPGIVADRFGRFNMLAVSAFVAGVITFCWTTATSVAGLVVWTLAFGFSSGAILSLQLACATSLADPSSAATVVGAVMGSTSLAALFATPIGGELIKHDYIAPGRGGSGNYYSPQELSQTGHFSDAHRSHVLADGTQAPADATTTGITGSVNGPAPPSYIAAQASAQPSRTVGRGGAGNYNYGVSESEERAARKKMDEEQRRKQVQAEVEEKVKKALAEPPKAMLTGEEPF